MFTRKEEQLEVLPDEPGPASVAGSGGWTPRKVLRERREALGFGQVDTAGIAGISQAHLSDVERGKERLTPAVARKLAAALKTTPKELVLSESISRLDRAAAKGRIDPKPLLAEVQRLAEALPENEAGDAVVDALAEILKVSISCYDSDEQIEGEE